MSLRSYSTFSENLSRNTAQPTTAMRAIDVRLIIAINKATLLILNKRGAKVSWSVRKCSRLSLIDISDWLILAFRSSGIIVD